MEVIVPFCGGSYPYRSRGVSVQESMNLYPEIVEVQDAKTKMAMVSIPGSVAAVVIGNDSTATCRGMYFSSTGPGADSCIYACFGSKVYRIDRSYTVIFLGDVLAGNTPVGITDNGFDLAVVDGTAMYTCDIAADNLTVPGTWRQVSLPYASGTTRNIVPTQVEFLNQRLLINDAGSNQFYFSNPASLKFDDENGIQNMYSAESSADAIRTMKVVNNRLWIFGDRSFEVWGASTYSQDSNAAAYDPLSRLAGYASQIGIQSYRSAASIMDRVFWLGASDSGRNMVMYGQGLNDPVRVSTNGIEHLIAGLPDADAGIGWCYTDEGHLFYCLSFAASGLTLVYDDATKLWHNRSTHDWDTGANVAWEPLYGVTAFNRVYYGSASSNRLLLLDNGRYKDADGKPLIRSRRSPVYYANFDWVVLRELYIDMEIGTTPELNDYGKDPQLMLRVSMDGGYTWTECDWRDIGKQGEYYWTTVKWENLGTGRAIVVEVSCSDPIPFTVYGARLVLEQGSGR